MKKILVIVSLLVISLASYSYYQYVYFIDHKLHVTVCDVGQGESILITTPARYHILIDGGPDMTILDCLSSHLPYWERNIDLVVLTHPHADHYNGIHYVIDRYKVKNFMSEKLSSKNIGYQTLQKKLEDKHISQTFAYQNNAITTPDGVKLTILGPQKDYLDTYGSSGVMDQSSENASVITLVRYGKFLYLLAGDSPTDYLLAALPERLDVSILQLPHHGSKTSTSSEVLHRLTPEVGIASVGENNRYGHPSEEVISLLQQQKIRMLRTDRDGSITTISDGNSWRVTTN